MPRKFQLHLEFPPPDRLRPEVGGKLGFDQFADLDEER
jgi:hypothetical protein